jgi:hypothetical protein
MAMTAMATIAAMGEINLHKFLLIDEAPLSKHEIETT